MSESRDSERPDGRANDAFVNHSAIRVPKTAELVAAQLRSRIVRGELGSGAVLPPEGQLTASFGISRPTLREALRILESESLIRVHRGVHGGPRVQELDHKVAARHVGLLLQYRGTRIQDVYDARARIEVPAIREIAQALGPSDISELRDAVSAEQESLGEPDRVTPMQTNFHLMLMQLVGNQTMLVLCEMLHHIIDAATWSRVLGSAGSEEQIAASRAGTRAHERLVDLLEAGDVDGAERLWEVHIQAMSDYISSGLPSDAVVDILDASPH